MCRTEASSYYLGTRGLMQALTAAAVQKVILSVRPFTLLGPFDRFAYYACIITDYRHLLAGCFSPLGILSALYL